MKKDILFIGHRNNFYGAESVLFRIIELFANEGYQTHVVLPLSFSNEFSAMISEKNIRTRLLYSSFRVINPRLFLSIPILFWNIISAAHLSFYVKSKKIKIIYCNTCLNIVGAYVSVISKQKLIWHFHEQPTGSDFKWIPPFLFPFYRYLILHKRTTIIFLSKTQKNLWEKELGIEIENSIIIYIPPRPVIRLDSELDNYKISFGFLGSFTEPKNILKLIHVFHMLKSKYSSQSFRLVIMGNGPLEKVMMAKINELKLEDSILMLKYQTDVSKFFSKINVFVLPSVFESWGLSALEALSLKCCAIITKNTALNEILTENVDCLFVNPNDEKSLYFAMEQLSLKNALRDEIATNGYNKLTALKMQLSFAESLLNLVENYI